jgi:MHS family citrate/tricarballylate:H+ symporter-like MFS transporter
MTAPATTGVKPPSPKQVAAIAAGNALEFYDFLTYSFFAVQIGATFFPSHDKGASLLASLATFGVGFAGRPIGAFVLGGLADRVGRKPAMLISFALMGLGILGLALTPSYKSIGLAAPILVILFRLLQGFALGGEVGPSTAFMIEAAPPGKRGLYVSFQYMSQDASVLASGLVGVALSSLMSSVQLTDYGWRIAFLIGAAIVPFGLLLRRGLGETLHHEEAAPPAGAPALPGFARIAALGLALLAAGTIVAYGLNYMTTYATATLGMPVTVAFGATVANGLMSMIFDPIGGWLSDRFGRKPMMILPWLALLVLVLPAFWVISHFRTPVALWGATAVMSIASALASCSVLVAVTEALPKHRRAGALSVVYAVSIMAFGGSAQFVVAALTQWSHNPMAPAAYMALAIAVGLAAMLTMTETAPRRIGRAAPAVALTTR